MKFIILTCIVLSFIACKSKANESTPNTKSVSTATIATSTVPTSKDDTSNAIDEATPPRNVKFYYNKMANVDGPEGTADLTIVKEDIKAGIITYKEAGSDNILKIQVWNKKGYDIINFLGSIYVSINNGEPKGLDGLKEADNIVKAVGGQRSARGGECNYNEYARYDVTSSGVIQILLQCSDDDSFKAVVGTVVVETGKLKVIKK